MTSNNSFAQQPSCNLSGPLKAQFSSDGGTAVVITAEIFNAVAGTNYAWVFKTNSSGASIVSGQGTSTVTVKSGTTSGNFTLQLTVTNSGPGGAGVLSCSCSKSVSVNAQ